MLILIHEPSSLWTAEVERAGVLQPLHSIRWRPHRDDFLKESPDCGVALLAVSPGDESLDLIRQLKVRNPAILIICLTTEEDAGWDYLAREVGVISILPDVVEKQKVLNALLRVVQGRVT